MARDRESELQVEDFMGVNQQVDRENIGQYESWQTQNMWEKKINVLETRGGSNPFASGWPSNINGIDNEIRIFKNTLDHKRLVALHGLEDTPGTPTTALPGNVTLAWAGSMPDPIGNLSTWLTTINTDLGFIPSFMILRFIGYGYDKYYSVAASAITGYATGSRHTFNVHLSAPMSNTNITAIEVYAVVNCSGSVNTNGSAIWCGTCDLIKQTSGDFFFYHAPISKNPSSSTASGGVTTVPIAFTIAPTNVVGGTLVPGKTYYVAVLPHYFRFQDSPALCQNSWLQSGSGPSPLPIGTLTTSIVLPPGQNAINVNYPAAALSPVSKNAMLVCIGEDLQLLIPYSVSNVNPGSPDLNLIETISSFPQNTPACVDIEYVGPITGTSGECNLRFRMSDFSTNDTLCRINNDGSTVPVFIARQSSVNRYDNEALGSFSWAILASSSGGSSPTIEFSPDVTAIPPFVDPLPKNTPIHFSGASLPTNITAGQIYYWAQFGNAGGVSASPDGPLIAWGGSGGSSVFAISNPYAGFFYPQLLTGFTGMYTGGYALSQPLIGQNYNFDQYQDLGYFVSGISNNPNLIGGSGFPNAPVSGTNYYVTDGNIAALVVFDFSSNPQPIPPSTIIKVYQDSVCVSGGPECADTVFFTEPQNPNRFEQAAAPGINNFFDTEGVGEWVTGFGVFSYSLVYVSPQSFLVVTKKNSCWILENLPTSFSAPTFLVEISKTVGSPQGRTIIHTEIGTIFASTQNVYLVKGGGDPVPIADPISAILKQSDLSLACAAYHDEQYKLSFYSSLYPGTAGFNNVEFWLDLKKMKQAQGKPDWKGPMLGRAIDFTEVENLTGDGTVQNLTRDRVCVDRQNIRVFKADVLPLETDTVINDFSTPVTSMLETKNYRVQEKDNNWLKLFTMCLWKIRTNLVSSPQLSATVTTYVDNVQADSQAIKFTGLAATNFDDQPQVYTMEFPTGRYRGRTIRKVFSTTQRVGICGLTLYYKPERRRIGS